MISTLLLVWGIVGICFGSLAVGTTGRNTHWSNKQENLVLFLSGPIVWTLILVAFICNLIWDKLE